jgi:hypothetical protein
MVTPSFGNEGGATRLYRPDFQADFRSRIAMFRTARKRECRPAAASVRDGTPGPSAIAMAVEVME